MKVTAALWSAAVTVRQGGQMRIRTTLLSIIVALTFFAGHAFAKGAGPPAGLDPSFGDSGIARVALPDGDSEDELEGFAISPDGRVYVLYGSSLLAIEGNGEIAGDFAEGGILSVAAGVGSPVSDVPVLLDEERQGGPSGLAVDSLGRPVIAGSTYLEEKTSFEAYVLRFDPDGSRDAGFGSGGEVDTDLDLAGVAGHSHPSVRVSSVIVDREDRPVLGGSFGDARKTCAIDVNDGPTPFVGRLTAAGAIDRTFGHSGRTVFKRPGKVVSIAPNPTGGFAIFSRDCPGGARIETPAPRLSNFNERGRSIGAATQRLLPFTYLPPSVDSRGRILELESPSEVAEGPSALVRFLSNGDRDRSFGRGRRIFARPFAPFVIDPENRVVIATGGPRNIELKRFRTDGTIDTEFGPRGRLVAKSRGPSAIALDAQGRIYTLGLAVNGSTTTLQVARFIPGS